LVVGVAGVSFPALFVAGGGPMVPAVIELVVPVRLWGEGRWVGDWKDADIDNL